MGGEGAHIWGHYGEQIGLSYRVTMGEMGQGGGSAPWCGGGEGVRRDAGGDGAHIWGHYGGEMGLSYRVTMGGRWGSHMGSLWGGDGALIWGHYGGEMGLSYGVTMEGRWGSRMGSLWGRWDKGGGVSPMVWGGGEGVRTDAGEMGLS